jgi:hypothetical protein
MSEYSEIFKYPSTEHIEGSTLQKGDDNKKQVPYKKLLGCYVVFEEKMDGANCGISFNEAGELFLQSRGHYLLGGPNETQFDLLKSWANVHQEKLFEILGSKYLMYGEWLKIKHTVFYDNLPHYFQEFDIFDKENQVFLSTQKRRELLKNSPVLSVPVLYEDIAPKKLKDLISLIGPTPSKTENWENSLDELIKKLGYNRELTLKQTETSSMMEGIYIKLETENETIGRYKFVRSGFLQTLHDSESHWKDRPPLPNLLNPEVNIFDMSYLDLAQNNLKKMKA